MHNEIKAKGVLLDLAGTLIKTSHLEALKFISKKLNLDPDTQSKLIHHFKVNFKRAREGEYKDVIELLQLCFKEIGMSKVSTDMIERFYMDHIQNNTVIISGADRLVRKLKDKGLKIGVITNTNERLMRALLERLEISSLVDVAVSASAARTYKPNPKIFTLAIKLLGLRPFEIMWIGNSRNDALAAKKCGMVSILLDNTADVDYTIAGLDRFLLIIELLP